jgi:uncharacterized SAM-binding protein YcdF (DUF218 family)
MFELSRTIQSLILPPGVFLLMMALGFLVRDGCRMLGRLLLAAGFVLLYLACINPVSDQLLEPLERAYLPLKSADVKQHADAIVVLGGGVRDLSWLGLVPVPAEASLERVVEGVRLFRTHRIPLVLAGGNGDPAQEGVQVTEAAAMAREASDLGVPERDMIIIGKGRNTLENAQEVRRGIKGNRIILVTSAYHMMRASRIFKKKGFEVIPAPCGFRSERRRLSFFSFIPRLDDLSSTHIACAEYISLAWHTMNGDL